MMRSHFRYYLRRMRMVDYKFRAECLADVAAFKLELDVRRVALEFEIKVITPGLPDVEVLLKNPDMSLGTLLYYMRLVTDTHVMQETLAPAAYYTGEREG
jgi:hypothetical protein